MYTRLSNSCKILEAVEQVRATVLCHTRYNEDIRYCESLLGNFVCKYGSEPAIDPVSTCGLALIGRIKDMVKMHFTDLKDRLASWKPGERRVLNTTEIKLGEDLILIATKTERLRVFIDHWNRELTRIIYLGVCNHGIMDKNEQFAIVMKAFDEAETELLNLFSI